MDATATLSALPHGYRLLRPINLTVEHEGDSLYVATDDFSTVYGDASTALGAIEDYALALVEYFAIVKGSATRNAADMPTLARLRQFVAEPEIV